MFAGRLTLEVEEVGRTETREERGIMRTLTAPDPGNGTLVVVSTGGAGAAGVWGLTRGRDEEAGGSSGSSFTAPIRSPHSMHFVSSGGSLFKEQILHFAQNLDEWAEST